MHARVFHVKPATADDQRQLALAALPALSDITQEQPGACWFHVKHGVLARITRARAVVIENNGGAETFIVSAPPWPALSAQATPHRGMSRAPAHRQGGQDPLLRRTQW